MDALVLVDTMGVATPASIEYFVRKTQAAINKPLEVHFHNDFGLAIANTLAALSLGVQTAHTAVCGLGERSGAAATEDVATALLTLYGVDTGIKIEKMTELAKLVVSLSGHRLPTNKSIVGEGLYTVESGIVAMWMDRCTGPLATEVFPLHWSLMGQQPPRVVLGKGSGKASVLAWLQKIGVSATDEQSDQLLMMVKEKSLAKKGLLTEDEFRALARQAVGTAWKGASPAHVHTDAKWCIIHKQKIMAVDTWPVVSRRPPA